MIPIFRHSSLILKLNLILGMQVNCWSPKCRSNLKVHFEYEEPSIFVEDRNTTENWNFNFTKKSGILFWISTYSYSFSVKFFNMFLFLLYIISNSQPSCQKNRHLLEFYMSHRGIIDLSRSFQSRHQYISNRHCLLFYFSKVRPYLFGRYLRF